jgi:transposase
VDTLFALQDSPKPERGEAEVPQAPRVLTANRSQVELRPVDLEALLPADHRARLVWQFVEALDLSELYGQIRAVEGHAGRPAIDPKILLALWLYATLEGVGSARALARLCEQHDAYRWIVGGVSVNAHTLADFRVGQVEVIDRLLTQSVAALLKAGAVTLERVAQDGMRVRASAGAASFRRGKTLKRCLREAKAQVEALRRELEADPAATERRQQAARQRAAEERKRRLEKALAVLPEVAQKKPAAEREEKARVSTTDPEARVMKMADGGYRPAYNAQLATDTGSQVIVGVEVTDAGTDQGQLGEMRAQLRDRYGREPEAMLVDGGFAKLEEIEVAHAAGCVVYAPLVQPRDASRDPYQPLPRDGPGVAAWRVRMGTEEAKAIYKQRAATAECVNALARNRGLRQLPVRGRIKAKAILLWQALAQNLMRSFALGVPIRAPVRA